MGVSENRGFNIGTTWEKDDWWVALDAFGGNNLGILKMSSRVTLEHERHPNTLELCHLPLLVIQHS